MIAKPFDSVTAADIQALVDDEVCESRTLDYKQELPGRNDEAKREFLADVTSFANATGGDLLYGITEKRDAANKPTGVPEDATGIADLNLDAERLRLEQIMRDGVDPRIPSVRIRAIDGFADGPVLLVRVQQSWRAPHMVTLGNLSRFYSRNSAGKYQLDVTELRSAFLLSEGRAERVQRFRDERLAKVIAGETPGRMGDGLKVILHVVPLAGSATNQDVSLQAAGNDMELWPLFVGGYDDRYNLDGLLKYYTIRESGALISYLQIFRNGALEAGYVYGDCVARGINGGELETEIIRSLGRYLHAESRLGVEPPFVVMLSLVGVGGCWVGNPGGYYARRHNIDQDDLLLPDVLIEDFRVEVDVVLRPLFDVLWQASGYARCPNYGEDGRHISARR